ncbi:MAG TPA: peptidase M50 [Bauldia sp.]|nr:peptidase M50 [Bauldia sp.]
MSRSMYSPLWHRVENLRLSLKPQTEVSRHVVRGEVWYVARDRMSNRAHRFSIGVYAVVMRMNGSRTLDEIWREVAEAFGDDAPSQDQIIQLVGQLYSFDLIHVDRPVDVGELAERADRQNRGLARQRYLNPLYLRLRLFDPNRFLDTTVHLVRPLFGRVGFLLWLALMVWFVTEAALNWSALTDDIGDRVLAVGNIALLIVVFPLLKAVHEMGHAYATKVAGGEVHEIGVMLLVLMPAPYVDASSSALFSSKAHRILVGAAGMMAELTVAAGAMAVWLAAEPGLVRAIAFNAMLIASVSTVAFNANPLLRFDGYYILSDLFELPNLATRAPRYYSYLVQRYLFGLRSAASPITARGERLWFLLYAPASFAYRIVMLSSIALVLAGRFFFVGVALAIWTVTLSLLWPIAKALRFVLVAPPLSGHRLRATAVTAAGLAALAAIVMAVPLPNATIARGVIWIPEDAQVSAGTDGTVGRLLRQPGDTVAVGDALIQLDDPYIEARRKLAAAHVDELRTRLRAAEVGSPADAQQIRQQIATAEGELTEAERRVALLTVKSPAAGEFVAPGSRDLIGIYAKQGQLLAYVMPPGDMTVRAAVAEDDFDSLSDVRAVAVRSDAAPWAAVAASVARAVPSATRQLPSPALAKANGGPFATDPSAKDPNTSLTQFFEVDLTMPAEAVRTWGERVWVRFEHGSQPLGEMLYFRARQVFLKRFNV